MNFAQEQGRTSCKSGTRCEGGVALRIGSYNIEHGREVGLDMSVLAEDLKALRLDVVGLQEVDVGTRRVGGRDTLCELAESAGYQYYEFCKAIDYQGGGYGTAIMSRYPIKHFEVLPLFTYDGMEGRAIGHARLDVDGTEMDYFNTHLSYENETVRERQFEALDTLLASKEHFILTADFNTEEDGGYEKIRNAIRVNHGTYKTFPAAMSAIDDIVLSKGWRVLESGMQESAHSDHNLLWAEIALDGGVTSHG